MVLPPLSSPGLIRWDWKHAHQMHTVPWESDDCPVTVWLGTLAPFPSSLHGSVKTEVELYIQGIRKRDSHFLRMYLPRVRNLVELYPTGGGGNRGVNYRCECIWGAAWSGEHVERRRKIENMFPFWLWVNTDLYGGMSALMGLGKGEEKVFKLFPFIWVMFPMNGIWDKGMKSPLTLFPTFSCRVILLPVLYWEKSVSFEVLKSEIKA